MVPASQSFEIHKAVGQNVDYKNPVSRYYMADGPNSLTDGVRGTFTVGKYWHGFHATDMAATIDLGTITDINRLSVGILQKRKDWIFPASSVTFEISTDGKTFSRMETVDLPIKRDNKENKILNYTTDKNTTKGRFIRVTAENFGVCPAGHPGEGKPTWLFVDEIVVE
ncbi:discoidin domain-containing protein [Marinilabilia salmonicolor]|nr:discoidin domain-containing protein [Marinilabilia salmonicolor]